MTKARGIVGGGRYGAGEGNIKARLSATDVRAIREAYMANPERGTQAQLARRYGVTKENIGRIVRRQSWKQV